MATNPYFNQNVKSQQNLYDDLMVEAIKFYGQNLYYIPRDIVNKDPIFLDDVPSRFNSSYVLEMYPEMTGGFGGDGDLFSKFGIEIRDQVNFVVSRKRWTETVKRYDNNISGNRPREGDLIYFPVSKSLFEIMRVEHEEPFYQLNHLPVYQLHCELFEYSDEDFDTNITEIDNVEHDGYRLDLTLADSDGIGFVVGNTVTQSIDSAVDITGEVSFYNDSSNILSIVHIGADDGLYHDFTTGTITSVDGDGAAISRTVTAINDTLGDSENLDTFDVANFDFMDFNETNPFGEPS
jgi:hypothetical protein